MPIIVACPSCGTNVKAPDHLAGRCVKCPNCAGPVPVPGDDADAETEPVRARGRPRDDDDEPSFRRDSGNDVVETFIPYKNGRALAAYYCGVFSLIPCVGLLLGPVAFILGILGVRYAQAHPKAKGMGHAIAGIVLGGLTSLGNWGVVIVIGISILMSGK
jgi:hypothetical protein